jgi:hypothetical protein
MNWTLQKWLYSVSFQATKFMAEKLRNEKIYLDD